MSLFFSRSLIVDTNYIAEFQKISLLLISAYNGIMQYIYLFWFELTVFHLFLSEKQL